MTLETEKSDTTPRRLILPCKHVNNTFTQNYDSYLEHQFALFRPQLLYICIWRKVKIRLLNQPHHLLITTKPIIQLCIRSHPHHRIIHPHGINPPIRKLRRLRLLLALKPGGGGRRKSQRGEVVVQLRASLHLLLLRRRDLEFDVAQGDAVEDLEEPEHLGCGVGDGGGFLDGCEEGVEAGEVGLVAGFDDLAEEDDEGGEGRKENRPDDTGVSKTRRPALSSSEAYQWT